MTSLQRKNTTAELLLMAFLTVLFVIVQWLHAFQRRSAAMPTFHVSTEKKCFTFTMSVVSCLYNFFLLVLSATEGTVLIHALPMGNGEYLPHMRGRHKTSGRIRSCFYSTPPGAIYVFTGGRQTKNHWQIHWRKGGFSQSFPPYSPPLMGIA